MKAACLMLVWLSCATNAVAVQAEGGAEADTFTVRSFDGVQLPARVLNPRGPGKLLLFVNGSTPYDEQGRLMPAWTPAGKPIVQPHVFSSRFFEVMTSKGHRVATLAKRSFVQPFRLPRPSLDELAHDVVSLIQSLEERGLLSSRRDLVLVGYSEGSIVVSKALGLLKQPPAMAVLLGSASLQEDDRARLADWPYTEVLRRVSGWTDDRIQKQLDLRHRLARAIVDVDEATYEEQWKAGAFTGASFAQWESFHIARETPFYDPVANLRAANVPLLFCVGTDDSTMPLALARRTFERLQAGGFTKATLRPIEGEGHGYRKHDVYGILHAWIVSGGTTTEFTLTAEDRAFVDKYGRLDEVIGAINSLPYEGGRLEDALACLRRADAVALADPNPWFRLGMNLAANGRLDEAYGAFERSHVANSPRTFGASVWMGHVRDLQGRRAEAVELYRRSLTEYDGIPVQHQHLGIVLDDSWVRARLEAPLSPAHIRAAPAK